MAELKKEVYVSNVLYDLLILDSSDIKELQEKKELDILAYSGNDVYGLKIEYKN